MTWKNFSRRQFAKRLTILGALPLSLRPLSAASEVAPSKPPAPPEVKSYPGILRHRVVFWDPYGYSAWPTILKCRDGEMLIAFCEAMRRTARLTHADPSFYGMIIRSSDQGESWSEHPEVIGGYEYYGMDDPGITQLSDGRILVNAFRRSFAPVASVDRRTDVRLARVEPYQWATGYSDDMTYVFHSLDNARTWLEPVQVDVSPFKAGCQLRAIIELPDGTLLLPCYEEFHGPSTSESAMTWTAYVLRSRDRGRSWGEPSVIGEHGVHGIGYNEPALIHLPSGRTIALLRTGPAGWLYQSDSHDLGKTWSAPARTPMWGYPAHLRQLQDGRLLATYGHRREPFGIRACLSSDEGKSWNIESEIVLRDDLKNRDLGYPTTTQLDDGTLLTAYYGRDENNDVTCIQITSWKIAS